MMMFGTTTTNTTLANPYLGQQQQYAAMIQAQAHTNYQLGLQGLQQLTGPCLPYEPAPTPHNNPLLLLED